MNIRTFLAQESSEMFHGGELSAVAATVAAAAMIFILLLIKRSAAKDAGKRYPPSIPALPLLVSLLQEGVDVLPGYFLRSAEKYGPVLSCKIGGRLTVILNSKEALIETLHKQSEAFADKFEFWTEKNVVNHNLRGIAFARHNETFKKYHKLTLSILKEFGFGVNSVSETRIINEIESMNEKILKNNGQPFDPKHMITSSTSSVVLRILFDRQFMSSDKNHRELINNSDEFVNNIDMALNVAPFVRFLPSFRKKIVALSQTHENMMRVIEEGIKCCKASETEFTFVRRFLEIEGPEYDHQDLLYILRDLCLASMETMSTTLQWAMVELANHPEVQTRLQREIDDAVPVDRFPSLDDKPHLHYTEAVISELMRRRTVAPLLSPRILRKDTQVLGYFVPKNTMILANMYSAHMNPKSWKDPENFYPDRFLDKDGNVIGGLNNLSFGLGKRSCLGEILARQEVFLFLTSLAQRFDIRPPEDHDSIRVKEVMRTALRPSDFKVRLIPRKAH